MVRSECYETYDAVGLAWEDVQGSKPSCRCERGEGRGRPKIFYNIIKRLLIRSLYVGPFYFSVFIIIRSKAQVPS